MKIHPKKQLSDKHKIFRDSLENDIPFALNRKITDRIAESITTNIMVCGETFGSCFFYCQMEVKKTWE